MGSKSNNGQGDIPTAKVSMWVSFYLEMGEIQNLSSYLWNGKKSGLTFHMFGPNS